MAEILKTNGSTNHLKGDLPGQPKFGGGLSETVLHPLVLIAMLIATALIFVLPRKHVIFPVISATFLIPLGQQFYFAGVHLFVLRLLILFGLVRTLVIDGPSHGSRFGGRWKTPDTIFVYFILIQAVAVVLLNQDGPSLVNQVGFIWDCLGGYVLLRSLIKNEDDIYRTISCVGLVAAILAVGMLIEQAKLVNIFGLLGGVRDVPEIRDGKIRSQGVFQHSLTAGAFAAASLPLFLLLWKNGKAKVLAAVGFIAITIMTFATQTSSSLLTYGAALLGLCFWPLRKKMRKIRWGLVVGLVLLNFAMKAPVWFLIARIDLTGSSSSYHRAELVDQFIRNFGSWWLIGVKDTSTWGWDMWDVQNQYVAVGETGGLAAFACFIAVISLSFRSIGIARKSSTKSQQWFLWCLGSALFATVVSFMGVNYFDQSKMAFYALLAMIAAYSAPSLRAKPTSEPESVNSLSEGLKECCPSLSDSVNAL